MFNKPYEVKGKHATYIRFLNAYTKNVDKDKNTKVAGLFSVAVDVYIIAPLIGASYNRRSPVDIISENRQDSLTIFGDAIISRQKQLEDIYRLIMLSEKSGNLSNDERVERAFRDDDNADKLAENMELFHEYMRGGVEWLYEQTLNGLSVATATQDDYLGKIKDIVTLFAEDFELCSQE